MKTEKQDFSDKINRLEFLVDEIRKSGSADPAMKGNSQVQLLEELGIALKEFSGIKEELQNASLRLETSYQQIDAEHARYLELFNFAPDTYLVTNSEGIIEEANLAANTMFNVSTILLEGKPILLLLDKEERESFHTRLTQILKERETKIQDWQVSAQSLAGVSFPASIEINIKRDLQGRVIHMLWLIRDLTESKRLQEEIVLLQKVEAVGRLAMGVAHDFNNLLVIISGNGHLALQHAQEGTSIRNEVSEIERAVQHGARLTKQLLAFTRHQKIELTVLNLNTLINDWQNILMRFLGEDIEIVQNLQDELWQIRADHGQMEQVLINLVINARDALPEGGQLSIVTSNVFLSESEAFLQDDIPPGKYVSLSVSDSGTGISDDIKPYIFESFFTTKNQEKGTGLGLATIRNIVKQSGGYIRVHSEIGRGTSFELFFPPVEETLVALSGDAKFEAQGIPAKTVLIVEDDPILKQLLGTVLKDSGFNILSVLDGEAALQLIQEPSTEKIDLVLTDIIMPRMNGKKLGYHALRLLPEVKLLFMSGYDYQAALEDDPVLPANFIQKPFSPTELVAKLNEILGTNHSA